MQRIVLVSTIIGAVLVLVAPLRASDPNQTYERLYGDDAKKLQLKGFPGFAEKLLKDAAELDSNSSPLAELLVVKATDLYFRSSLGDDKTKLGETLIDRWLSAADAQLTARKPSEAILSFQQASKIATANKSDRLAGITARIKVVQGKIDVEAKLSDLLARWKSSPDNPALAKELTLLYVLELDRPAEAVPYVGEDEALKTYVPLAAKDANELGEAVLTEIGGWYESLAAKASPAGKAVAYERAKTYYETFLARHASKDQQYLTAKKALEAVNKQLETLPAVARKSITVALAKNVSMTLAPIPAGKFLMGAPNSEKDGLPAERPQHEVKISKPFYMGMTAVTQAQFDAVMGQNPSQFKDPNSPVERVTWEEATAFCKALCGMVHRPFRLPTEAEWEYACRAGTKTRFSFGDDEKDLGDYAWVGSNADKRSHPVALKKPNPWGLYDMHGNVYQWCSDWYDEKYYASADKTDPIGPASGTLRVQRGGSWVDPPKDCRSAMRGGYGVTGRINLFGFRVVMQAD